MKISSPLPSRHARIEVVPLIDIMFFLLAAFVLVSLTMVKQLTVEVDLPAALAAARQQKGEPVTIGVDAQGQYYFGHEAASLSVIEDRLRQRLAEDPKVSVAIAGDSDTSHGVMVALLQRLRAVGAENVGFALRPVTAAGEAPAAGQAPSAEAAGGGTESSAGAGSGSIAPVIEPSQTPENQGGGES